VEALTHHHAWPNFREGLHLLQACLHIAVEVAQQIRDLPRAGLCVTMSQVRTCPSDEMAATMERVQKLESTLGEKQACALDDEDLTPEKKEA